MEAKIIERFLPSLVTAVKDSVLSVSDQCLANGLIPGNVHEKVLEVTEWTSRDKARTLILAVKNTTESDSSSFDILLNILEKELPSASTDKLS